MPLSSGMGALSSALNLLRPQVMDIEILGLNCSTASSAFISLTLGENGTSTGSAKTKAPVDDNALCLSVVRSAFRRNVFVKTSSSGILTSSNCMSLLNGFREKGKVYSAEA